MHVVMRQNFVPRISFYAKLEVAVPNIGRYAVPYFTCQHVIVKFLATGDCVPQHGKEFARSFEDFGNWIDESLVIARLMSFDRGSNRCHDIRGAALFRKKNLNAR